MPAVADSHNSDVEPSLAVGDVSVASSSDNEPALAAGIICVEVQSKWLFPCVFSVTHLSVMLKWQFID